MRLRLPILALVTGWLASAAAQSNDNFANRLTLSGAGTTAVSNNLSATREAGEPNHAANAAGRSLWWTWTAPTSGVVNFSTFSGSSGVTPPRTLAVYTGGTLSTLTEAGSSNDLESSYAPEPFQNAALATGTSLNVAVTAGTAYQIAVDAAASSLGIDDGTVVLSINTPPTIVSAASVNAVTGAAFQYNVLASNGPTAYGASNLPPGLSLNPSNGQISGVLTADGTYAIGLSATGPGGTGTATLTIQVGDPAPAAVLPPAIGGYVGTGGYVGASFTYYFDATGSPTSYTATNLPPGLTLDGVDGEITGTPTSAGTFAVPITATNAAGTGSATVTISIAAAPLPPVFYSAIAASATVGYAFSYYIDAYNVGTSVSNTSYTASGLPPGLSLSSSDEVTGTPTQAGVYPVAVSATNAGGTRTATVTITVNPAPTPAAPAAAPPQLDSSAATAAAVGTAFSYALAATNAPTGFGASNLPPGLSLDTGSGAITGTPTTAGVFLVPVSATNAYGTSTAALTINVFASVSAQTAASGADLPLITSAVSASGYTGQPFGYTLIASYNGEPAYYPQQGAWTYAASGLPPGLTFSTTSPYSYPTISGTPTTAGTYQTTVSATLSSSVYYLLPAPVTTTAVVTFFIKAGPVVTVPTFTSSASLAAVAGTAISSYYPTITGSPTSYAASGLPPGLSFSATNGYISGTPTTAGTYQTTLTATNSAGTGSAVFTYIVTPPTAPLITSAATAYWGVVGTAFTYTVTASPAATAFAASNLPPGLSLNPSTGAISGTPTTAGVYTVPLSATNAVGTGNATLTITVAAAASSAVPVITGDAGAQGTVGTSFYYYLDATNSPTSYASGTLPPGLTLDTYGDIEGTPTTPGTYTVPLSATNAGGTGTATLTISIAPLPAPVLSGSAVLNATINSSISYYVSASSSPTSYTASGLPSGVTLNAATGYLSGAVAAAGSYPVTLSATNASGTGNATLTINVVPVPAPALPVITSAAGATGAVGSVFSYTVQASGSPASYDVGGLPAGWTFNPSTGVISGTPTAAGTYPLTLSATNATGTGSATLNLVVATAVHSPPVVTSAPWGFALLKEPFNYFLTTNPPAASYSASNLPAGLSLNATTGQISGTPTSVGGYTVQIVAANAAGSTQVTLNLPVINPSFAVFTSPAAVSAVTGQAFSTALTSSGTSPSSSTASPLPKGLSINASTGVISGTPTVAGSTSAAISQYTSQGYANGRLLITVAAAAPAVPVISNTAGVGAYAGVPFAYALQAANAPTSFTASGLPAGLTLNASTGLISGTPTVTGLYPVTVSAANSKGVSGTATVSINVATLTSTAPVLSAASVAGLIGTPLTYTVTTNTASFYYLYASNLPPGLTLNGYTGVVSGTPTTAGVYYTTFNVTNSNDASSSTVITFQIAASPVAVPTLTSPAGAAGTVGTAFSYTVAANNGATSLNATGLPTGLSFSATTGVISGTPAVSGTFSIPLTATNSIGQGSAALTLAIAAVSPVAPTLTTSNALIAPYTLGNYGSVSIYATGNPTRYAASNLPPGLSVNAATGYLSGTLTTTGTYPVTISASNAAGSASAVVTFIVTPVTTVPAFTYLAAESTGDAGIAFSTVNLEAAGAPASYAASGLPPGLSLNATSGSVTGTPTVAGVYPVTVSATNAAGTGSAVWTVVIYDASVLRPVLSSANADLAAVVGQAFNGEFPVTAQGGSSSAAVPLTFSYGGLPPGLSGNASSDYDADLSGTPTAAGVYPVTITATTPGGLSASEIVTLVITSAPPAITSPAGVVGNVGSALTYALSSASTVSAYTASNLPPGLTLNAATGAISGTPTVAGTYVVPVAAAGIAGTGSATVTFQIAAPAFGGLPVINSAATANWQDIEPGPYFYYPPYYVNSAGAGGYAITAINGPTSFGASNLPAGLSLNPYTGVISGQPLVGGTFHVPISATNAAGTCNATLTILATASLPTISVGLSVSGSVGAAFGYVIETPATEYNGLFYDEDEGVEPDPLTFAATGLPPGLTVNTVTGYITGTPTQAGTYPVALSATNRAGTGSAVLTFIIAAMTPPATVPPIFEGAAMADGFIGFPLNYSLSAAYAASYSASGLPAGLSLDPVTGYITGTPAQTGTFSVPVSATNAAGTAQAVLTVAVDTTPPPPTFYGLAASTATIGTPFVYAMNAESDDAPAVTAYSASNLPAGLSLNPRNGLITGTPTGSAGTFLIPISASIGASTSHAALTLNIQPASTVAYQPALAAPAGALGFMDNPLTYALGGTGFTPASTLPAGLSFDAVTGAITGYPASVGTYQIPLATSGTSRGGTAVLTLNVLAPDFSLPRLTGQPAGTTVLQNGSATFAAAAIGAPPPTCQWTRNGVPLAGATAATLTLAQVQPADAGTYALTAANAAGQAVSSPAVLTVQQTYATWQAAHFTTAEIDAGLAADGDDLTGDGTPNLLKYALGIDPLTGAGGSLPVGTYLTANGVLRLAFTRDTARTDIDYIVEASPDLSQWTPIASSTSGLPTANLGGALTVIENGVPGTSQVNVVVADGQAAGTFRQQFLRLRVVRP